MKYGVLYIIMLSIVIPIYNEQKTIKEAIRRVQAVDYDKEITYKMFFILSYSISQLIKLNTNQTTPRVLIYLSKSIEAYAAMFGTLMSGGYYSPLNVNASSDTKSHIIKLFTPIFVCSRISGWTAHIIEQRLDNKLLRPGAKYVGKDPMSFISLNERS